MNTLLEASAASDAENLLGTVLDHLVSWCLNTGIKVLIAVILLVVSFRIITVISRKIEKKGDSEKYDKTIMKTLAYIFGVAAKVVVAVGLIGYVGIDTSGITALIASLGVCFGLAVNGAVANIAGGVLIIVTRPFRVDDYIEAQGVSGTVDEIRITATRVITPDNKVIYIPNGALSSGTIINYSEKDTRRVDHTFSIAYENDAVKAMELLNSIVNAHELVLKDPAPTVRMSSHGESSINIVVRVWTKSSDYWTVHFDLLETVKAEFDKAGISIPYNQLDVHIKND
jgi:small conductance mechanosensitive channel